MAIFSRRASQRAGTASEFGIPVDPLITSARLAMVESLAMRPRRSCALP